MIEKNHYNFARDISGYAEERRRVLVMRAMTEREAELYHLISPWYTESYTSKEKFKPDTPKEILELNEEYERIFEENEIFHFDY